MTVPILPNFFSALQNAGVIGVDAYREAQDRARQDALLRRQQDMQNIQLFTQLLPHLAPQPEVMGVQGGDNAGIPLLNPNPAYSVPSSVQQSFGRITGGVPRLIASPEEQIARATAAATPGKLSRQKTAEELANVGQATRNQAETYDLVKHQKISEVLQGASPDQVQAMIGLPNEIDLATRNDAQLKDTARRLVFGFHGDWQRAAKLGDVMYPNLTKDKKLNEAFYREAASEWQLEQQKLAIELERARNAGGRRRDPSEELDNLIQGYNTLRSGLVNEQAKLGVLGQLGKQDAQGNEINPTTERKQYLAIQQQINDIDKKLIVAQSTYSKKLGVPETGAKPNPDTGTEDKAVLLMRDALKNNRVTRKNIQDSGALTPEQKRQILGGTK